MTDYRKLFRILFVFISAFIVSCTSSKVEEQIFTGEALGTTYQVKYFHSEEIAMQKGLDSIFHVINNSMSTYQADSDISRINSGDTIVVVDENFRQVYNLSKKIFEESNGYFDPTIGKLVNAYGFGPEIADSQLEKAEIDSLLTFVGFDKISLTGDNRIIKEHPAIFIDFNAIAKGYAVDVIARFLDNNNVSDYLVELGGELIAKGMNKNKEDAWVVGIDDPSQSQGTRTLQTALKLENRAMATSGNYRKFRDDAETGEVFVHTINPITGLAEKSNLLSASVLAENCTLADGYATAFMSLGFERSLEMLERLEDVDVYLIYADENAEIKIFTSPGFEEALLSD